MGIIKRFASENYVAEQITTEINNTVVNFENTAGDLVSAHNVATDAHADIREQITQLQEEKANKSGLTLGVHTDGLVYIFIDGAPHGNGLDIKADVVDGDVFGYVDENNVIVLNGALADGTYTIKYEMENGTVVNIGNMVLDTNVYYTVKNTLTNCTSNNSAIEAVQGGSYSATITAKSGYELSSVKVTMGGTDISSTAVSGDSVAIASVTGNIVITAVAEEISVVEAKNFAEPNDTNTTDWSIWCNNARVGSDGAYRSSTSQVVTNYIPVQNGDIVHWNGMLIYGQMMALCKSDKTHLFAQNPATAVEKGYVTDCTTINETTYNGHFTINNESIGFIRFTINRQSMSSSYVQNNVVINIERNGEYLVE